MTFLHILDEVLLDLWEGRLRVDDRVQELVDTEIERGESEETPWFIPGLIYKVAKQEVDVLARKIAEETLYLEEGERAVSLSEVSAKFKQDDAASKSD